LCTRSTEPWNTYGRIAFVSTSLRVLSVDARRFGRDRASLARLISDAGVDVACVHGGPHLLRWRSISAALGRQAGLVVVTGGRPAGANLLLSTLGVDVTAVHDVQLAEAPRLNPPGAALAALRLRGIDFLMVCATLVGNSAERVTQARDLQKAIDGLVPGEPPVIICAEGADRPGTAAWQALVQNRVGAAGLFFVDGRIGVEETTEIAGGSLVSPTVVVDLAL
jgi:hypothetical protein